MSVNEKCVIDVFTKYVWIKPLKKCFVALKAEVDKLDINKLVK